MKRPTTQAGSRNCQAEMPGGAGDHHFQPAIGHDEGGDRSEQRRERKHVLADARHPVRGEQENLHGVELVRPNRAVEVFEIGDRADQQEKEDEDRQHHEGKPPGEIKGERPTDAQHCATQPPRAGAGRRAAEEPPQAVGEDVAERDQPLRRPRLLARQDQAHSGCDRQQRNDVEANAPRGNGLRRLRSARTQPRRTRRRSPPRCRSSPSAAGGWFPPARGRQAAGSRRRWR